LNAQALTPAWNWLPGGGGRVGQPPPQLFAGPTVVNGVVYIGSNTGDFYALSEQSGKVRWRQFLGFRPSHVCGGGGIVSTAAVATPKGGKRSLVYVGGGNGNLYALDAQTGKVVWHALVVKQPGYIWGSPTVSGGHVYIGVSAQCDQPLVRGGVKQFDALTGAHLQTYWAVPHGKIGASVWSSVAAGRGATIFVTTGNAPHSIGTSFAIAKLDTKTLTRRERWRVPNVRGRDYDFGASPTLFTAGRKSVGMVGACNKNGKFYAFRQTAVTRGPTWVFGVSTAWPDDSNCLGGAVWDSGKQRLLIAGGKTHIGSKEAPGSIRRLNPLTGAVLWEQALSGPVWGSPSADGSGVVAVPNYGDGSRATFGVFLVKELDGLLLASLDTEGSAVFAQPVFADGYLLVATIASGLIAFAPSS